MSQLRQFAKVIVIISLSTLCGCTDQPVFEKLFSTDHFDYYIEPGVEPPCDGADEWLERYYEAYANFFGARLPAGQKIQYHLVADLRTMESVGCADAHGCTFDTTIYTYEPIHPHEIAHANAFLVGLPPLVFVEGIAELLGCTAPWDTDGTIDTSAPLEDLVESEPFVHWQETNGYAAYGPAANFVRYLIDTFGVEKFLSFYAHTPWTAKRAEIETIFEQEIGIRLDDALADWRQADPGFAGDNCLRLLECDPNTPILQNGDIALQCGPLGGSGGAAIFRFDIHADRTMQISTTPKITEPQEASFVRFYRCPRGNVMAYSEMTAGFLLDKNLNFSVSSQKPTRRFILDEPPGQYVARFGSLDQPSIHVEMTESPSPMRNGCTPAPEPLVLQDKQQIILTSRWMDRPCSGFWCPGHSWDVAVQRSGKIAFEAAVVNDEAPATPDKIYLCTDPCPMDPMPCEEVTLDVSTGRSVQSQQIFEPGTIVHVGAPLAPLKEHFSVRMRLVPPCNGRVPCTDPWHGPR